MNRLSYRINSASLRLCTLTAVAGISLLGCNEVVDSDAIRTRGMWAGITAETNASGDTKVSVDLAVGGDDGTLVNLTNGDKLIAHLDDSTKTLKGSEGDYSTNFSKVKAGDELRVELSRGVDDDDAPNSTVEIAKGFDIKLEKDRYGRDEELEVTWEPADSSAKMHWEVEGDCISLLVDGETKDDGKFVIDADEIDTRAGDDEETCEATLILRREIRGKLDSAFEEGGYVKSIQVRKIRFTSTPEAETEEEEPTSSEDPKEPGMDDVSGENMDAGVPPAEDPAPIEGQGDAGGADVVDEEPVSSSMDAGVSTPAEPEEPTSTDGGSPEEPQEPAATDAGAGTSEEPEEPATADAGVSADAG